MTDTSQRPELDAARLVLQRMGVTPQDLLDTPSPRLAVPTFADYIPQVAAAVSDGTRRVYASYWKRINTEWGHRRLDEPTASDIKRLAEQVRTQRVRRRNARGGHSAAEHLIAAMRCLYNHAVADRIIAEADNPARQVAKPRRQPSTRRGLPDSGVEEVTRIAATTGNDPILDSLILRLHIETACRRGGALALTPADLDPTQSLILLREKGDTQRWQPVSPTLIRHLHEHAHHRGAAESGGQLLRYRTGKPITTRRYDHLWHRIGQHLPWVATQQISTHWLRHTTLTWVERHFGYAVARAYAGHTDSSGDTGVTTTYVRAGLEEVAAALSALTGETHPLAPETAMEGNDHQHRNSCRPQKSS
ncbi:tyrosine-type recombinase/integrase [Saccharopolyspora rosea]|uniref:tyrosine-type recombinase/integrase n=1 Tax=Saccharopolyspora rosea TaxID=524884 RepID=UPI0021D88197|nr:site-specific integrase [Saccharopolyspora rosea]